MNPKYAEEYWTRGPDIATSAADWLIGSRTMGLTVAFTRDAGPDDWTRAAGITSESGPVYILQPRKPASLLALCLDAMRGAPCP